MVRGTSKQIIHLKNPESALFEEAFLIVKNAPHMESTRRTMVEEANRLLAEPHTAPATTHNGSRPVSATRFWRVALIYLLGVISGTLVTVLCLL